MKQILLIFLFFQGTGLAQDDGRIVFTDPKSKQESQRLSDEELIPRANAWGADLMLGNDGFGMGFFYHRLFSDVFTGSVSLSFSEIKDSRQLEFVDSWGNQSSPNKINRVFRVPFFAGVQYRLFKDVILDNFRPYLNAGAGPVLLYITSAQRDFFSSLGHGDTRLTVGGFLGFGAHFGFDRTSVLGVNVRYYLVPLPTGIRSVEEGDLDNGNGFFITLNFGFSF
jgi:hypothetical protein